MSAELIISAVRPDQFPNQEEPEYAFLGRSNVGKSTLLNCLVGGRGLARTSSKPGCTQVVNFYRVDGGVRLVDLPGYGYARAPARRQQSWGRLAESYLLARPNLVLSFLLLDARRGWMEKDLELKRWLEFHQQRYLVIATKIDKLKSQQLQRALVAIRQQLSDSDPVAFSALTGQGVREIWQAIRKTRNPAPKPVL